jgi:MFS family permease
MILIFDHDYDRTITWVFFLPYILFELPSNLVLKRLGARNWLSFIVIAWGAVMTGMAFVTDWRQLVACRVLLGTLESGFFPGCVSLYPQHIFLLPNSNT